MHVSGVGFLTLLHLPESRWLPHTSTPTLHTSTPTSKPDALVDLRVATSAFLALAMHRFIILQESEALDL